MKWFIGLRQKNKIAILFGLVFLLIFVKNMLDRKHVSDLGNTFSTVYEDRLLAESYLFRISSLIHREKLDLEQQFRSGTAKQEKNDAFPFQVERQLQSFEATRLTARESVVFKKLRENIAELNALRASASVPDPALKSRLDKQFDLLETNLDHLSAIQVNEGKDLSLSSRQIIAGNTILTQFEFGMLLVLGIIIHVLIFSSRAVVPKNRHKHQMN